MAEEFFKKFNNVSFERGTKIFQTKYAVFVNFENQTR
jgi:hypothetical protein